MRLFGYKVNKRELATIVCYYWKLSEIQISSEPQDKDSEFCKLDKMSWTEFYSPY
jgi:hypothetical protein